MEFHNLTFSLGLFLILDFSNAFDVLLVDKLYTGHQAGRASVY